MSGQTLELLDRNLETVRRLHEFSQKSVDAGVAEQVDADQILVQVATLETSINEARRGLEMIYNSMRLQMNIGFDKEIVLTQTLEELMDVERSLDLLYDDLSWRTTSPTSWPSRAPTSTASRRTSPDGPTDLP